MKKLFLISTLVILCCSCKKDKEVTIHYNIKVHQFNGSLEDLQNLDEYLGKKECFTGIWTVTEYSVEAADLRINYIMTQEKKKLSRTELTQLLGKGCNFTYSAARHEDISDDFSPVIFVGKYTFPK